MTLSRICIPAILLLSWLCSFSSAGPLYHLWSQRFGETSVQMGNSVATDASGNVILVGEFADSISFGGDILICAGESYDDIFIAKFDEWGNHIWSRRYGDTDDQYGSGVTVDGSGNVIMTGCFQGSVDFGGGTLTSAGDWDFFLVKFDAAGNHLWSKSFGDVNRQLYPSVSVDGSENVFLTGYGEGAVDFGGGTLTGAGDNDIFLAKFDASGNHLWSKHFGDASDQSALGVAIDGSGSAFITGWFQGSVDFGGVVLTSVDNYDIFLARFDASGSHIWSQRFGGSGVQLAYEVAVDGSNNVVVTGSFSGDMDFGGGTFNSAGGDIFLAKFDPSGSHIWSDYYGDSSSQYCRTVAVDGSGSVVITGSTAGTVDFGGGPLTPDMFDTQLFVAKLDSAGNHVWSQIYGDAPGTQDGLCVATDGHDNVLASGYFSGSLDFGGDNLTNAGLQNVFLVKFDATGPICDVQPDSIDFGEVEPFSSEERVFKVRNTGLTGTVEGDISEPCANYSIVSGTGPYSLAAGESLLVTVRFDPAAEGTHVCTIDTGDDLCSDVDLTGVGIQRSRAPLGIVGWWPFDETGGTTAYDLYYGYDGTHQNGPTPIPGHVDYALEFDGSNDYVTVPDNPDLNITGDVTVEVWFKLHGTGTYQLVSKGGGWSDSADLPSSYVIEVNSANLIAGFEAGDGGNFLISTPRPSDEEWHHVAYRRVGNLNELYLDGIMASDSTAPITPGSTSGISLHIGTMYAHGGNTRYLDGALDELTIYNRALDPSEILEIYTVGAVGKNKDEMPWPQITDIVDVPDDQGGKVRIHFVRSLLDHADEDSLPVTQYAIHQRVDNPALVSSILEQGQRVETGKISATGAGQPGWLAASQYRGELYKQDDRFFVVRDRAAAYPSVWEVIGTVPARQEQHYIFRATTVADSCDTTTAYQVYFVAAHTTTPSIFFDSPVDSGYSVDNIAPGVPTSFAAAYNTGAGNTISWDPCPDEDFQYFCIYRSDDSEFIPSPGTLIHTTTSTTWSDPEYDGWQVFYKVTAVDDAGNESEPTASEPATGIGYSAIPLKFALFQNVPNPFNPSTVIRYDVPSDDGIVSLRIYDVAGRLVRTLVNGRETAGRKYARWNGFDNAGNRVSSGIYLCRLETPDGAFTNKMLLLK